METKKRYQYSIMIPVYKNEMDIIDKNSLRTLCENSSEETKKDNEVVIVTHEGITDRFNWESRLRDAGFKNIRILLYDKENFNDTVAYSKMMKSYWLYDDFSESHYLLVFQNDCVLFVDRISSMCQYGYDYIGAPQLKVDNGWLNTPCSGNGGCSLRKVDFFKEVTDPGGEFMKTYHKKIKEFERDDFYIRYEDLYFCEVVNYLYKMTRPSAKLASNFIIDMNPDLIIFHYGWTNGVIPGLLHAYDKNLRWYRKYCDIKGITDNDELYEFCEEKYRELHEYYMTDADRPHTFAPNNTHNKISI